MQRRQLILLAALNGIFSAVLGIVTNYATTKLPPALEEHPWRSWLLVITFATASIGAALWSLRLDPRDSWIAAGFQQQASQNRMRLIERVHAFWIEGILYQSLHQVVRIELGLTTKPDAVPDPWAVVIQQPERPPQQVPLGTPIDKIFHDLGEALLILGNPGAGKTTLLLELARGLLQRANQDQAYPVPVVFHLSSWAERRSSFSTWLIDELYERYSVPRGAAKEWIENEGILPLLDGLDEVAGEYRSQCTEMINAFRQEHGLLPIAICSRISEYEALKLRERLRLQGAIVIQPLTWQQREDYLVRGGDALKGVRAAVEQDPELERLLDTPLMLSIVALAYRGISADDLQDMGSLATRRAHLFTAYVDAMFRRRRPITYPRLKTIRWLIWLARAMSRHGATVLDLRKMNIAWLVPPLTQQTAAKQLALTIAVIIGSLTGLVSGAAAGILTDPLSALLTGLITGLVVAWAVGLTTNLHAKLTIGLDSGTYMHSRRRAPAEIFRYSGSGLAFACGVGLITGLPAMQVGGLRLGLIALAAGLATGLGAFDRMIDWLRLDNAAPYSIPQGLMVGGVTALAVGMSIGLSLGPTLALIAASVTLLIMTGVIRGTVQLHYAGLRILLARHGFAPWGYTRFLDYATERVFLRRVGDGYLFVHRLLMDYFARDAEVSSAEARLDGGA